MSYIYFNTGEKKKLIQCVSKKKSVDINIELIKKKYAIIDILLQHINIPSSLINVIFEYTHDIILVEFSADEQQPTITLQNNVIIRLCRINSKCYGVDMNYDNTLFEYKFVTCDKNNNKPINIINSKKYRYINLYPLEHFIDYYMVKYYNKQKSYIKNLNYSNSNYYGICKNTYYQYQIWSKSDNNKFHVMRMLDHKKIKQMIIIVKLFVDLLSKI